MQTAAHFPRLRWLHAHHRWRQSSSLASQGLHRAPPHPCRRNEKVLGCIKYMAQALQGDVHKGMQGLRLAHRRLVHWIETAISPRGKATETCSSNKMKNWKRTQLLTRYCLKRSLLLSKIDYEAANGNFFPPFNCVVLIHGKNRSGVQQQSDASVTQSWQFEKNEC